MKDDEIMHQLKEILVGDEKKQRQEFETELKKIEHTLYDHHELKNTIDPIIDERFEDLRSQFNTFFGAQVQQQIKDSEEELIKTLTPIMGKLIKKWIAHEFVGLKESVNEYINSSLSFPEKIYNKIKSIFIPEETFNEIISKAINTAILIDVFIIQKKTGFMMAQYSEEPTMNQSQMAGMLTALIGFGEDALRVGVREKIRQIQYELYTVHIHNDFDFYAAILFSDGIQSNPEVIEPVKKMVASFIEQKMISQNYSDDIDVKILSKQLQDFLRAAAV